MKRYFKYFFSYRFSSGYGCITVSFAKKINAHNILSSLDIALNFIKEELKDKCDCPQPVILFYQYVGITKEKDECKK